LIDCSASGGAETKPDARAGKKEGGWGEGIFARPRFSAAAEFRISLCEMRRQEIDLIKFILFGSIAIEVIIISTIILPKLYIYDKWKNN
jgi:hypothetical protein